MIILPDDIDTSLRHAVKDDFVIFVSQSKSPLISGDGLYSIRRQGEPLACKKKASDARLCDAYLYYIMIKKKSRIVKRKTIIGTMGSCGDEDSNAESGGIPWVSCLYSF